MDGQHQAAGTLLAFLMKEWHRYCCSTTLLQALATEPQLLVILDFLI